MIINTILIRDHASSESSPQNRRKGAIAVLAAILMVLLVALLAFTIDLGYLLHARTEMQRSADAAALAGAWEMVSDDALRGDNWNKIGSDTRLKAAEFAALNKVVQTNPYLDVVGDIDLGYLSNPSNHSETLTFPPLDECNTVQVRIRYADDRNKPISFFFAPVLGIFSSDLSTTAAATFTSNRTVGFRVTDETGNSKLLPFAIKADDWKDLLDGNDDGSGNDNWTFDPETGTVSPGSDGIPEMRMYPENSTGNNISPGNFGTVDIGNSSNSTADLRRQILEGPSAKDFEHYTNNELKLDPISGEVTLNGDTGISNGMKSAVAEVVGQPRAISLYKAVSGQGNQSNYTVVGFAGVRVMDVSLTGGDKYILIQPSNVTDPTAIVGDPETSYFVGPPVHLVR